MSLENTTDSFFDDIRERRVEEELSKMTFEDDDEEELTEELRNMIDDFKIKYLEKEF